MKYYFAYGSNMLERRLRALKRVPDAKFCAVGQVPGRRLAFHKASSDESGKCDIPHCEDPSSVVHGVLYEVPDEQLAALDRAEGVGFGYIRESIEVRRDDGISVSALVYVAEPSAIQPKLAPFTWYHAYVVAGAREHNLPPGYIFRLAAVAAIPDPDTARAARAQRVLDASFKATENATNPGRSETAPRGY